MQLPGAVRRKTALTTLDIKLCILIRLKLAALLNLYFLLRKISYKIFCKISRQICNILQIPIRFTFFRFILFEMKIPHLIYTKWQSTG